MTAIFVLNGPNLNLLGEREPEVYGRATLSEIEAALRLSCEAKGIALEFRQTNHEGVLIDWIHEAGARKASVILNAGAYTHSSIALRDAIVAAKVDAIEVHISNIHAREDFRHASFLAAVVRGSIVGLGDLSYHLALEAFLKIRDRS